MVTSSWQHEWIDGVPPTPDPSAELFFFSVKSHFLFVFAALSRHGAFLAEPTESRSRCSVANDETDGSETAMTVSMNETSKKTKNPS